MERNTGRSPPSCRYVLDKVDVTVDSTDLVEFAAKHPQSFVLLLAHASLCDDCSKTVKAAFPNGFATPDEKRQIDDGLQAAEEMLACELTAETENGVPKGENGSTHGR